MVDVRRKVYKKSEDRKVECKQVAKLFSFEFGNKVTAQDDSQLSTNAVADNTVSRSISRYIRINIKKTMFLKNCDLMPSIFLILPSPSFLVFSFKVLPLIIIVLSVSPF